MKKKKYKGEHEPELIVFLHSNIPVLHTKHWHLIQVKPVRQISLCISLYGRCEISEHKDIIERYIKNMSLILI